MKIGNLDISSFKVGAADCKVYLGDTLLYPTTPPPFQGKWKATYTGGSVTSAECDSSSAITGSEIALTDLVSVEIGDCVTSIGEYAFYSCMSLTSVTIPDSVTTIGNNAFGDCRSLTGITIPNSVTSIGQETFYGCYVLSSATIPNSVTSIGQQAFQDCYALTAYTIGNDSMLTSIDGSAFNSCTGLTNIIIPSGVTSIGDYAFASCSSLTSITVNATTPPALGGMDVFYSTNNCPIYVPAESVNAYQTATYWSTYASRIQAIPT